MCKKLSRLRNWLFFEVSIRNVLIGWKINYFRRVWKLFSFEKMIFWVSMRNVLDRNSFVWVGQVSGLGVYIICYSLDLPELLILNNFDLTVFILRYMAYSNLVKNINSFDSTFNRIQIIFCKITVTLIIKLLLFSTEMVFL